MRMLALAQSAIGLGWRVRFLIVDCPQALLERLGGDGCDVVKLEGGEPGSLEEAAVVAAECRQNDAGWLVLDGYHFSEAYQEVIQKAGVRILLVDDHAHAEAYSADAILNQNLFASPALYEGKAKEGTDFLTGSPFVMLRREFLVSRENDKVRSREEQERRRLLITVGGADPQGYTQRLVLAASRILEDWRIQVVAGAGFDFMPSFEASVGSNTIEILESPADMAKVISDNDVVISAAGSTVWEVLFLRKRLLAFSLADNQIPIGLSIEEKGVGCYGEDLRELDDAALEGKLVGYFDTVLPDVDEDDGCIDGSGAARVLAYLRGALNVTIATSESGWFSRRLDEFAEEVRALGAVVDLARSAEELKGGDVLVLLSWQSIVSREVLDRYRNTVVVHASDLPNGRGWSPMIWEIIEGRTEFTFSLLEAAEEVDSGTIYVQEKCSLSGTELVGELRDFQVRMTLSLCLKFLSCYPQSLSYGRAQVGDGTWYPRRGPEDSVLDPERTIADQFDLLRTVDNEAYPAFFEYRGERYLLKIEKDRRGDS